MYSLAISIGIGLLAGTTTVAKAYRNADGETLRCWVLLLIASVVGGASVGSWNLVLFAYPGYLIVLYGSIVFAIQIGRWRARHGPNPNSL